MDTHYDTNPITALRVSIKPNVSWDAIIVPGTPIIGYDIMIAAVLPGSNPL